MDSQQIIDREAQYGRTVGVLGIIGVVMILLPPLSGLASDFNSFSLDEYIERYEAFEASRSDVLASQLLSGLGLLLFAAPLLFLFQAALDRSTTMRRAFRPLTVIGPVLFATAMILMYVAYASTVDTFIDGAPAGGDLAQFAEDTLTDSAAYSAFLSLQLAAALSLVFAVVYTSLHAMRVGLLTRFMGTLGMALGIGFLIFGPVGPLALGLYVVMISLLIADWWRIRPPAWAVGEAVPWQKAGDVPPPADEEPANPEDFVAGEEENGRWRLSLPDAEGSDGDEGSEGGGHGRRKRKQRR